MMSDLLTRRQALGFGMGGFLGFALGRQEAAFGNLSFPALLPRAGGKAKSVIVFWLGGGASQFETWDPKAGRDSGGPTKDIETNVSGIRIAEHLPRK